MATKTIICTTCSKKVTPKAHPGISCAGCQKTQHFACLNLTPEKKENYINGKDNYLCVQCKAKHRRSLSFTVETPSPRRASSTNQPGPSTTQPDQLLALTSIIDTLKDTVASLESKLTEALNEIAALKSEREKPHKKRDQTNPIKTKSYTISGVPESAYSEPRTVVEKVLKTIDNSVELCSSAVVRKLTPKDKTLHPILLIDLKSDSTNCSILDQLKRRKLSGKDVDIEVCEKVFVNDSLPSRVYQLYKKAKQLKQKGYRFVWVKDNRVLVRIAEKASVLQIKDSDQVDKLLASITKDGNKLN